MMATGEIEIPVQHLSVLSEAQAWPFPVDDEHPVGEATRLAWRFLDLRRSALHQRIEARATIITAIRQRLEAQGFVEISTPILTSSSPEGARDFLVPSRLHPGSFFALPQAPQQYKQLLMASGFERYYQIAPCFRDEDARADRAPGEFYQLDLEVAYATQEEVFGVVEELLTGLFRDFGRGWQVSSPFLRVPYAEALRLYGSDKPDLRNPLTIVDVSELFARSEFQMFKSIVMKGGLVRGLAVPDVSTQPRSFFDDMQKFVGNLGAPGLAWIVRNAEGFRGPVANAIGPSLAQELTSNLAAALPGSPEEFPQGAALFLLASDEAQAVRWAGALRLELGHRLQLSETDVYRFAWITDFPLYEMEEESGEIVFSHNPFSMPQGGLEALQDLPPLEVLAWQYDIFCNGIELSSGAVRNHRPDIMGRAFEIAGYPVARMEREFGAMLRAFRSGCPPHAGIAPGIERILMLLADAPNLREVTAFPKDARGRDLLMEAPAAVDESQLQALGLRMR